MPNEIEEIRKIVEDYLKSIRSIDKVLIIFARRTNGNWKVVVRYSSPENPDADILSMILINRSTKVVDYFKENISSY